MMNSLRRLWRRLTFTPAPLTHRQIKDAVMAMADHARRTDQADLPACIVDMVILGAQDRFTGRPNLEKTLVALVDFAEEEFYIWMRIR